MGDMVTEQIMKMAARKGGLLPESDWRVHWVQDIVHRLDSVLDKVLSESAVTAHGTSGSGQWNERGVDLEGMLSGNAQIPHQVAAKSKRKWVVRVILDDKERNAFVLPNGDIYVYTGMINQVLSMAKKGTQEYQNRGLAPNPSTFGHYGKFVFGLQKSASFTPEEQQYLDAAMATVLSHEISHHLAHHIAEKQTTMTFLMIFQALLNIVVGSASNNSFIIRPWMTKLIVDLPFSRKLELEADYMGLVIMSLACFDPSVAGQFWSAMSKGSEDGDDFQPSEILSTHPAHKTRIQKLKEWLPQMRSIYEQQNCHLMHHFQSSASNLTGDSYGYSSRSDDGIWINGRRL